MSRIAELKKVIKLAKKNGHIEISVVANGRRIKQVTSITSKLTEFEKNAVVVHTYKMIESTKCNNELKKDLNNCNYAEVFGSPWTIQHIG